MKKFINSRLFARLLIAGLICGLTYASSHFLGSYWLVPSITIGPVVLARILKYALDRV